MARDYAKVSPRFWTGETGKKLRTNRAAQVLATYLISAPGSTMTGIYYLALPIIAHETGMTMPEVIDALAFLASIDFAHYDGVAELVWVPAMASWQIGASLKPNDNQVKGIRRELAAFNNHEFVIQFWERYGEAFSLGPTTLVRGARTPSKALRSQEHDQDQEHDQEISPPACDPSSTEPAVTGPWLGSVFGSIRAEVIGGIDFHAAAVNAATAATKAAVIAGTPGARQHVEASMRRFWTAVRDGSHPKATDAKSRASLAFGCWFDGFHGDLEEFTGRRPKVSTPVVAARGSPLPPDPYTNLPRTTATGVRR